MDDYCNANCDPRRGDCRVRRLTIGHQSNGLFIIDDGSCIDNANRFAYSIERERESSIVFIGTLTDNRVGNLKIESNLQENI